jgi:hypothetical protein
MGVPPGNRRVLVSVPEGYVAGGACPEPVEGTPEDARKDGHIIRARCAPLSPASGFPVSWSQHVIHEISGLKLLPSGVINYFNPHYPDGNQTYENITPIL